jgi:hypothetical protein
VIVIDLINKDKLNKKSVCFVFASAKTFVVTTKETYFLCGTSTSSAYK